MVIAPPPPAPPPPKEIIEHAVFVAAEEIEIAPGRLRAPLVRLFQRLGALGVTYEQAMSAIAPPPVRAARPSGPRTG